MAIRPLDMQNMVPKLQELSRISQLEQEKASVNQQQISSGMQKKENDEQKTVVKSKEDEKARNNFDAKDEGKGTYSSPKGKGSKKQNKDDKLNGSSEHKIDIKI